MIKIDIISGFLGAGKTTLIKKILDVLAQEGEKVVIIENEFGQVGIDGELIRLNGFEVYEISQGCICCTLKEDFVNTLSDIIHHINPDRIIFEPSGIFIPDEIFNILKIPQFSSTCTVNSVTTVIDSVNYLRQSKKYTVFFEKQIAVATTLVLSKTQLITPDEIDKISRELSLLNDHAEIMTANWEEFNSQDIHFLLDNDIKNLTLELAKERPYIEGMPSLSHDPFDTVGFRTLKNFAEHELEALLEGVKAGKFGNILRAKGFLKTNNGWTEFSYVDGNFTLTAIQDKKIGKACFIGTQLVEKALRRSFGAAEARIVLSKP